MPWTTVYLGPRRPEDLHLHDEWGEPDEADGDSVIDAEEAAQNDEPAGIGTPDDVVSLPPLTHGSDIAHRRMGLSSIETFPSHGAAIARLRERT
ncbi:hypothetical protein [Bifidobacterium samirii]|uniref:hypothetical protein n=1 Tax=Bifidobacterium samirii TaxID=2306974 RepID=UPI000F7F676E|nr:hypothetical protein [Bifidobacterium samirii]